ncbi:TIGR03618 family F420-dependent PPOX class oxidoreductase [Nonomuraea roseoviolacea]|uniref:TIGR03618 family F420-dependent PPOX class oxidoreductase n=1 Tax=Nonomuraea roseoviolacea TaxID=103837 RepID=UPI0031E3AA87
MAHRLAAACLPRLLLVRDPARAPHLPGAAVARAGYTDRDAAAAALRGIQTVLMVSASESPDRLRQHRAFIDVARVHPGGPRRPLSARRLSIMSVPLSDSARGILDGPNIGILATLNPDGSPQTSVVWVGTDGDDVVISSEAGRRKVLNLERDPRASLSVFDLSDPDRYVEVRGLATVTEDEGRRLAATLAEKYEGAGGGEEYLRLPPERVRVVIRITPQRVLGNAV